MPFQAMVQNIRHWMFALMCTYACAYTLNPHKSNVFK